MLFATSLTAQFSLTVEESSPAVAPGSTYRFYVDMNDTTDRMSAIFGNNESNLIINTPDGAFNSSFNSRIEGRIESSIRCVDDEVTLVVTENGTHSIRCIVHINIETVS